MNEKSWLVIRTVAGLYVVYLGYQIVSGVLADRPGNMAFMMTAGIFFIIIGAIIAIISIKSVIALRNKVQTEEEESSEEENSLEEEDSDEEEISEEAVLEDRGEENNKTETAEAIEDDAAAGIEKDTDGGTGEDDTAVDTQNVIAADTV